MVPLALGTQTVGSVLRPAAYCGVVGFKPTHGRISTVGVTPLAWSLDHVGVLCRSVEDAALGLSIMAGHDPADPHSVARPGEDFVAALAEPGAPRIGVLRSLVERAEPANAAQIEAVLEMLRKEGARVEDAPLSPTFEGIHAAGDTVARSEAAAFHRDLYGKHAAEYPKHIGEAVKAGLGLTAVDYLAAQAHRRAFRADMSVVAARYDAIVSPTAAGPAPKGLDSTGDPYFCAPWSSAGMPSISLPTGLAADGLPFAVQLTAMPWGEARLLAAAAWCERALGFSEKPRL
jgi:Asp-tRNA(Asn)/Glu-tRNA(Gln) amidotransferase A subunit family amidase